MHLRRLQHVQHVYLWGLQHVQHLHLRSVQYVQHLHVRRLQHVYNLRLRCLQYLYLQLGVLRHMWGHILRTGVYGLLLLRHVRHIGM